MLDRAQGIAAQLSVWRRDFHMHPELGFREARTAAVVAEVLRNLGYRVRTGVGRTGVVAERGVGRPVVAIRADMDALPIVEANDVPYASQNVGVMHACGHDAHTAIGLGVATLLAEETFPGTVRFLFQPAEEVADAEGRSGAQRMAEDGAIDGVDRVLALHVDPDLAVGDIIVAAGPQSAGVDTFYATIVGRGGHGASPETTVDPIYIAGHVILALNAIISRRRSPLRPAVISIGSIQGGETDNVIPDRVKMSGTIRYLEPEVRALLHVELERVLGLVKTLGGDYELRIEPGGPPMVGDPGVVDVVRQVADDLLGPQHLRPPRRDMGAEDFGVFSSLVPGTMFSLGCRLEGDVRYVHSPQFDLDERCLPIGAAILAEAALRLLRGLEDPGKLSPSSLSARSV